MGIVQGPLFKINYLRTTVSPCGHSGRYSQFQGGKFNFFDVHVTVHRDKFLIIKPTRCTNY